jgi:hypothetical protein
MKISILLVTLLFIACTHHRETGEELVVGGQCENEFYKTSLSQNEVIWRNVSGTGKVGASYLITGLSYSTDFLVSFTGGVVSGVAMCSPLIALDMLATASSTNRPQSSGGVSSHCIGRYGVELGKSLSPELGPRSKMATQKWRCPDLDSLAEGLIRVSTCYETKGEKELAAKQLENLRSSEVFHQCLSFEMKKKLGMTL